MRLRNVHFNQYQRAAYTAQLDRTERKLAVDLAARVNASTLLHLLLQTHDCELIQVYKSEARARGLLP